MATVETLRAAETKPGEAMHAARSPRRGIELRIFLTCWLVYLVHWSPFVVRELYLAMSLAERHTVRVDPYVDLHPDLFTMPGRGSFLGNNPGAAFLAAVPYWLALPVAERVAPVKPRPPEETQQIEYKEQRRNRQDFYRKVRERGLDVRLAVAALVTSGFLMAPLAAWSAVVMYRLFGRAGIGDKARLWLALVHGLGTPIFFRAATLSLNLIVALLGLFAFALLWRPEATTEPARTRLGRWLVASEARRYFVAGALAGYSVVTDYTGVVTLGMLGVFALASQMERKPLGPAARGTLWFVAGALGPGLLQLGYQWYCFGNPWIPPQFHMPKQYFLGYPSERGFGWPLPAALWGLIFDPLYGLLVFAPMFALAVYHPLLIWRKRNLIPGRVALFCWMFAVALWVFSSCIHYTVRHQWQDGVRYLVPAVPFLFLLVGDVLARMPRGLAWLVAIAAVGETWALAMVRESPLESLARVLTKGFQYPWLTTLSNAATQYFPPLGDPASVWSRWLPPAVALAMFAMLWLIWRMPRTRPSEGMAASA